MRQKVCVALIYREQERAAFGLNLESNRLPLKPTCGGEYGHDFRDKVFAGLSCGGDERQIEHARIVAYRSPYNKTRNSKDP